MTLNALPLSEILTAAEVVEGPSGRGDYVIVCPECGGRECRLQRSSDGTAIPHCTCRAQYFVKVALRKLVSAKSNGGGHAKTCAGLEIFSADTLLGMPMEPARYVVPGILPEGVGLLAAKAKLGKTWWALGLCVSVASGRNALGGVPVEQGDALFLGLEDNLRRVQRRLAKLVNGGEALRRLDIAVEWPRLHEGGLEALEGWLVEHPHARLVVIDTLAKFRAPQRGQNVYAEDYAALEPLLPLAAKHRVAILVVHHTRKMAAADPLDEISGSTGLSGGVDSILVMRRDRGQADAVLHVDGRDIEEPAELALRWDAETAGWTIMGDAAEVRMSRERREIVRVLGQHGVGLSPKEVAEALDKPPNTIKQRMWQMAQDGQLEREDGRYRITHNLHNPITE